ncbi:unnamed protein product [Paramecium pentaurelia]|uniref:MORN repeat-containing protein 3 n=1 Tax=Paramecium pentaurelia TaxID=43138 RepID=A0A8S1WMR1_9CILI|nr:unnamed protein product [Paramecium pentaurelia]
MNNNFQIDSQTFKSLHDPMSLLPHPCLFFTQLYKSKDNKIIKKKLFETKEKWETWSKSITQELLIQRQLSSKYPGKILKILNYTVETINHESHLYISYDCEDDTEPLFQYLNNNSVNFQEQAQIFEQLLQITCIFYKSQFEHTNLKPNNILYYKKQVLITDFGSERTHYQNFLKPLAAQAEKEWQNILIYFYPQDYQKIMSDVDFKNESWLKLEINNQKSKKYIDIWALSMMMIQVFQNNQTLPNKLTDYYGLNKTLLLEKIENLKQYQNGIYSNVIYELLIEQKDPEQVYQIFLEQKQCLIQTEFQEQMEQTYTIREIVDLINDDDNNNKISSFKPEKQQLTKLSFENLLNQIDNDASKINKSNNRSKSNQNLIPNSQQPTLNQLNFSRDQPQNLTFEFSQNIPNQFLNIQDNDSNQIIKKPNIVVTNFGFNHQEIKGIQFEDTPNKNLNQALIPIQSELQIVNGNQSNLSNLEQVKDKQEIEQINKDKNKNDIQLGYLQSIQLNKIDDKQLGEALNNQSPIFQKDETQALLIQKSQNLNTVNEKDNSVNNLVSFKDSQNFQFFNPINSDLLNLEDEQQQQQKQQLIQFQGQKENQNQVKQINIFEIDDFENVDQQVPKENQVQKKIIKSDQNVVKLQEIDDSQKQTQNQQRNSKQTNSLIIIPSIEKNITYIDDPINNQGGVVSRVEQNSVNVKKAQLQQLQPFYDQNNDEKNKIQSKSIMPDKNLEDADYSLLSEISQNDKESFQGKKKSKEQSIIHFVNDCNSFQQIKQYEDPEEIINQESKDDTVTLKIIKNILNKGVIQLQDKDQKEILEQLKIIQKILTRFEQNLIDTINICEDEQDKKTQKQTQQFYIEILQQNQNDNLQLIENVNDGIGFILKKQEADKLFDDNKIENNHLLLTYLNENQLQLLKEKIQGNKLITDQIQKIIDVKDHFKKLKQNPNLQNLLKNQQFDLLNKEELKIYQQLLYQLPKERKQGDRLLKEQSAVERKLKEIKKQEEEELKKQKFIDFLRHPTFDKLLPNVYLRKLNNDDRKKYKAALKDLQFKSTQRQKNTIQEQIDIINEIKKKNNRKKTQIYRIDEVSNEGSTKLSSKINNQLNFQDAFIKAIKKQVNEIDTELLSLNKYIREFQLNSITYQITDLVPGDCQNYKFQFENRKFQFYDFQGSKYKGETLNDYPDGFGILRKRGVSSIYKGFFKKGKFYWGQVLEMNNQGQLTQYVGYYNQEYEVKHGKARLKWYQPQKIRFCGGYQFYDYEIYEGDFILGYIHGKGKKIYADQSEYEGQWKKNKRQGLGILTLKQGGKKSITYEGQFQDDVQHGKNIKAIHHHQTGLDLIVEGEYLKGKPIGQHILIFNSVVQREIIY